MKENQALVNAYNLPFSWKDAVEVCRFLRKRTIQDAKKVLGRVLEKKTAVPIKKFGLRDRGHRPGKVGPGFYQQKSSMYILKLLKTLEANAQDKGLNVSNLILN